MLDVTNNAGTPQLAVSDMDGLWPSVCYVNILYIGAD